MVEYLKKEIDSSFLQSIEYTKSKKQNNPVYCLYINSDFDSILIYLIKNKDQKTANTLITKGLVDITYRNKEGKTALDYANEYGLKSIVKNIEKAMKK